MNRTAIIEHCGQCPHFDNEYYSYFEECTILDRHIKHKDKEYNYYPIPEDCPLPNQTRNDHEEIHHQSYRN